MASSIVTENGLPRVHFPATLTVDLDTARALVMFINVMRTEPTQDGLTVKSHWDLHAPDRKLLRSAESRPCKGPPTHMADTGPVIPMMA